MLRFRLRTLLIAVAVLAVPIAWVGWQYRIVSERKAALGRRLYVPWDAMDATHGFSLSAIRRWFGDEAICLIECHGAPTEIAELRWLFPEAQIGPPRPVPVPEH